MGVLSCTTKNVVAHFACTGNAHWTVHGELNAHLTVHVFISIASSFEDYLLTLFAQHQGRSLKCRQATHEFTCTNVRLALPDNILKRTDSPTLNHRSCGPTRRITTSRFRDNFSLFLFMQGLLTGRRISFVFSKEPVATR